MNRVAALGCDNESTLRGARRQLAEVFDALLQHRFAVAGEVSRKRSACRRWHRIASRSQQNDERNIGRVAGRPKLDKTSRLCTRNFTGLGEHPAR